MEWFTVDSRFVWCTIHPSWITFLPAFLVCFIDCTTLIRGMLPLAVLLDIIQQHKHHHRIAPASAFRVEEEPVIVHTHCYVGPH